MNVIGVDIGGATTDVFSTSRSTPAAAWKSAVQPQRIANLGMSYSISNVMAEAGWRT